jgi:cytochrome c biogenesis protein CcmG, thiol:disulfide interchange protein DsbE
MSRWLRLVPLIVLGLVVAGLAWRIAVPRDDAVPSKLVGQMVPRFEASPVVPGRSGLSSAGLATGSPRIVNFFASWCVPCITEVSLLEQLKTRGVAIDGLAVRDRPEDVGRFLERHGDPYQRIGADPESRIQIALGSSGVPESFIVDGRGLIRYQHIGPIEEDDLPTILAELEKAR